MTTDTPDPSDRRWFELDETAAAAFDAVLDRPPVEKPYRRTRNERTGALAEQVPDEVTAPVVREITARNVWRVPEWPHMG